MENREIKVSYTGASFPSLLFLVFLVLKLCNVINWSWWWVFAPIWLPSSILLVMGFIVLIIAVIATFVGSKY